MCPYTRHAPQTEEGWQAWDVVERCAGQLRIGPSGHVIGLDMGVALQIGAALGYDMTALAELLPAAEVGIVAAVNRETQNG